MGPFEAYYRALSIPNYLSGASFSKLSYDLYMSYDSIITYLSPKGGSQSSPRNLLKLVIKNLGLH